MNYGLALMPEFGATGRRAAPFVSGKALMITPNCERPDVAIDLLKYFTSADAQIALAKANRAIPTNKAAVASADVQAMPDVAHFAAQAALGVPLPTTPYMSGLWEPVTAALEALWAGQAPEQVLQEAQAQALKNIAALR
jgi:arabinogalactan oligomer/maltooligosaccharide transport system substrate-binding protein